MVELTKIPGIGPVLATACAECGFSSVEKIATANATDLSTVRGVSDLRAKQLINAAQQLLEGGASIKPTAAEAVEDAGPNTDKVRAKKHGTAQDKNKKQGKKKKGKKKKGKKKNKTAHNKSGKKRSDKEKRKKNKNRINRKKKN